MADPEPIDLHFPVLHQYWMDSGLLGFYLLAKEAQRDHPKIEFRADETGVHLRGSGAELEIFLTDVYNVLLNDFYNTSTSKQKEENAGFYYDTEKDEFVRFPKAKPCGIAGLIFSKASRPTKEFTKYVKGGRKNLLPEPYTYLQERLDDFLRENNLKADGAIFLINGRNSYKPDVIISPSPANSKKGSDKTCHICGEKSHKTSKISSTVLPMTGSGSGIKSFFSGCDNIDLVCWKCGYVSKFVPVVGHYSVNNESTYIFLMYSQSFGKMIDVAPTLRSLTKCDENYFRNYEEQLGSYFQHPFEQFLSFLYTVYLQTCVLAPSQNDDNNEGELDLESLYGIYIDRSPVSIYILHVQKLGDAFVGKLVWNFTDSVYVYRLFHTLFTQRIDIKEAMKVLIDYEQEKNETKTLVRNRICERVLKKQPVIDLFEPFVYHICRSKLKFIKPAYDFVLAYEQILAGEDNMKQELINTAVSLGKTLGLTLGSEGMKARGDLFRLRKARKPADFLNEVNRIQMKYNVSVTADLYNSGEEFDKNFAEFKQFCMVAALNSFNAKTSEKKIPGE